MEALDDNDWACLDEIGELLIGKGANDRLGITLLHSHFPVDDAEIMVEEPKDPFDDRFCVLHREIDGMVLASVGVLFHPDGDAPGALLVNGDRSRPLSSTWRRGRSDAPFTGGVKFRF
jgi:hypothetical protein